MSFRVVPKLVTLNYLELRNGRYIALVHWILVNLRFNTIAWICGGIYARVCCILWCVYDVKKVHVRNLISWWVSCWLIAVWVALTAM